MKRKKITLACDRFITAYGTKYLIHRVEDGTLWPEFTEILVDKNKKIISYIDIVHIKTKIRAKRTTLFGIQEFGPDLMDDFRYKIPFKAPGIFAGSVWGREHQGLYHFQLTKRACEALYKPEIPSMPRPKDRVIGWNFYELRDGYIITNVVPDEKNYWHTGTYEYPYETRVSEPTQKIKDLAKKVDKFFNPSVVRQIMSYIESKVI